VNAQLVQDQILNAAARRPAPDAQFSNVEWRRRRRNAYDFMSQQVEAGGMTWEEGRLAKDEGPMTED